MLLNNRCEKTTDICINMYEFQRNHAERKKVDVHEYVVCNFIYMKFRTDISDL